MRRWTLLLAFTSVLAACASAASASIHVRIAVSPDSIPQCGEGHFLFAIRNDGTAPVVARVCLALVHDDSLLFGPACGRVPLAAGETRTREFSFVIPPRFQPGNYAFVARAVASDSSRNQSVAPFVVTPGACVHTSDGTTEQMMNGLLEGAGILADPTPNHRSSWGELKIHYH